MNRVVADGVTHVERVRRLYKLILRLHRGLPKEIRSLGDDYVRNEFKRHKDAEPEFVTVFMHEWANYAVTLGQQLGKLTTQQVLGLKLGADQLGTLRDDQIGQLFELYQQIQVPQSTGKDGPQTTDNADGSRTTMDSQPEAATKLDGLTDTSDTNLRS